MEQENDNGSKLVEVMVAINYLQTDATGEDTIYKMDDTFIVDEARAKQFGNSVRIISNTFESVIVQPTDVEPEPSEDGADFEGDADEGVTIIEPETTEQGYIEPEHVASDTAIPANTPDEDWKVPNIKAWLDENDIEFPKKAVKFELLKLVDSATTYRLE